MRRFTMYTTFALVAFVGAVAMAQGIPTKITTLPDHVAVMKSNAQANGALGKALASGAFADATTQVATLRTNLTTIRAFWMGKKNKEAVTIVDSGLMRLDALGKLLAAPAPDQMAAQAAAKEFGGNTCGACHKQFREGDAQTGFKFRDSANQP